MAHTIGTPRVTDNVASRQPLAQLVISHYYPLWKFDGDGMGAVDGNIPLSLRRTYRTYCSEAVSSTVQSIGDGLYVLQSLSRWMFADGLSSLAKLTHRDFLLEQMVP